jgi:hypothetical protein
LPACLRLFLRMEATFSLCGADDDLAPFIG